MERPRLTRAAVPLVAAVSAVQLVVASLFHRVTQRSAGKVARRQHPRTHRPTGELVWTAAPAPLLVLPRLRTVPFSIAALLLCEAPARRSPTTTFPRGAVASHMKGCIETISLRAWQGLVLQREEAGGGFQLDWFVIGGTGDLSEERTRST